MKVGILTKSVSRYGGGIYYSLSPLTKKLNSIPELKIEVVGLEDSATNRDLIKWGDVKIRAFKPMGPPFFGFSKHLSSYLCSSDFEILHIHGLWSYTSIVGLLWKRKFMKPYIVSLHGMLNPFPLSISRWKKKIAAWLYENRFLEEAACIHVLSESESVSARMYGLKNPVCIIPNGIDLPRSLQASEPEWGKLLPSKAKILLYLGRLHIVKGISRLLYAWRECKFNLKDVAANWFLIIAGWDDGGYEAKLRKLANDLKIMDSVIFIGPQFGYQKHATYCRADAFILPSFSEALPMTVLEAWSYKLPVLMTEQCNLHEGFQCGAAIAMKPDSNSIAKALKKLFMLSQERRNVMGEKGMSLVRNRYSWDRIGNDMYNVYKWVAKNGEMPPCVRFFQDESYSGPRK